MLFWNSGGLGWSIGKSDYLTSGSHWHRSGLDTPEPWQGRWQGGVEVTCVTDQEEEEEVEEEDEEEEAVGCQYSAYSGWSGCSASCGVGEQVRRRRRERDKPRSLS